MGQVSQDSALCRSILLIVLAEPDESLIGHHGEKPLAGLVGLALMYVQEVRAHLLGADAAQN